MRLINLLKMLGLTCDLTNIMITNCTRKFENITHNTVYFSFGDVTKKSFEAMRNRGAYVIIGESEYNNNHYIKVDSIKKVYQKYLLITNKKKLKNHIFIGVTGTCAKTTISTMIFQFLKRRKSIIYYGSNGIYKDDKHYDCANTTPSMEEFFHYLGKEKYVVMEISSISFFEYRLFGIKFNYMILTNIYEDHLDYHKTLDAYKFTKYLILNSNFDAKTLISDTIEDKNILRLNFDSCYYGFNTSLFTIKGIDYQKNNTNFVIDYKGKMYHVKTNLIGEFSLKNISAVILLLLNMNYPITDIISYFNSIIEIPGRLNLYQYRNKSIIIDYPHTSASFEAILETYHKLYGKNLLVIYGAGGERWKSKRKEYSTLVSKYCKFAIVTNDNPRNENELEIINDLITYLDIQYEIIPNRKDALKRGLELLDEYSAMLILGKGSEKYIDIKNSKIPYSDINTLKELME